MRVILAAVAFTAISFAAGVAGDLTRPAPAHGESVVVRIPPPIPSDAPRAAPLPVLRTAAAEAAAPIRQRVAPAPPPAPPPEAAAAPPKPWRALLLVAAGSKYAAPEAAKPERKKQH